MKRIFTITALVMIPALGFAATINVPADFPTIQQAINAAVGGDVVLVGPGTYVENIDFQGKTIAVTSSHGPGATIIDGNQAGSVVTFANTEGPSSLIEGFTITNGLSNFGGGIFCDEFSSPTIRDNVITENEGTSGGGIYTHKLTSTIHRNVISKNTAGAGGGLYCWFGSPVLVNNTVTKNMANNGGGLYLADNVVELTNNTIAGNTAVFAGGGIIVIDSSPVLTNGILWDNSAPSGPQIEVLPHGTATVSFSDVQGGWAGVNNMDLDPLFVDAPGDDYHLTWISPCINQATNLGAPSDDIDGDARPFMGTADMGSDEYTFQLPLTADVFEIPAGAGGVVNFSLNAGRINRGRHYLLLGSISGTVPGTVLPGGLAVLPLNLDAVSFFILQNPNTPVFQNFSGTLDALGTSWAKFDTLGPVPVTVPITVSFAYGLNNPWNFVSNPVQINIMP